MNSYRELKVWQMAMELAEEAYRLTHNFPKHELYGLTSQIQRAAVSIPANVAEGHGRSTAREYVRCLAISRGSLAELETELMIANRLGYVDCDQSSSILSRLDEIGRMLRGLQNSLKRKLK
jgi:four helix bundle protein